LCKKGIKALGYFVVVVVVVVVIQVEFLQETRSRNSGDESFYIELYGASSCIHSVLVSSVLFST
jgi:hypothetical protein